MKCLNMSVISVNGWLHNMTVTYKNDTDNLEQSISLFHIMKKIKNKLVSQQWQLVQYANPY